MALGPRPSRSGSFGTYSREVTLRAPADPHRARKEDFLHKLGRCVAYDGNMSTFVREGLDESDRR